MRPQTDRNKGFRIGVALFAVAGFVCLGTAAVSVPRAAGAYHDAEQYQQDGRCGGGGGSATLPPSCRRETAVVLGKSDNYLSSRRQSWHNLTLTLRRPDGSVVSESLVAWGLWHSLAVGDPVWATVWRGRITGLAANGHTSNTSDDPGNASLAGVIAVAPWGIGAIFCAVMVRFLRTVSTA